jgi:hypothetical protein
MESSSGPLYEWWGGNARAVLKIPNGAFPPLLAKSFWAKIPFDYPASKLPA